MKFIAKLTKPECRDCYVIEDGREYFLTPNLDRATVFEEEEENLLKLWLNLELDRYYYNEQYRQQGESTAKAAKELYLLFQTYNLELIKQNEKLQTEK
jgi:hypothetical protein